MTTLRVFCFGSVYIRLQLVQTTLVHIGFASLLENVYFLLTSVTRFKIVLTTVMKSTAVSIRNSSDSFSFCSDNSKCELSQTASTLLHCT